MDDDSSEIRARSEDYWQAITHLTSEYAERPEVKRQQMRETAAHWLGQVVVSLLIGPLLLLYLIKSQLAPTESFLGFLHEPTVGVIWFCITAFGWATSLVVIPKKEHVARRLALANIRGGREVPFKNREF